MRRLLIAALALALLPAVASGQKKPEALWYYVDNETSWADLQKHIDQIDIVAPDVFGVDSLGTVWGELDARVLALAKAHHVQVHPLIVNKPFDYKALHVFLSNDVYVRRAIDGTAEICRRYKVDGIQVDFENLHINDRDAFTRFYRGLGEALHAAGCKLSIAVVHRPDELAGPAAYDRWMMETWRGGYDLKALGEISDFVTVMSYSEHTRRTPPGPSAAIDWATDVAKYFLRFMPPEKLSLGVPTGASHWFVSQEDKIQPEMARSYSNGWSYDWAMQMLQRHNASLVWNDQYKVSYGFYPSGGTWEWVFLEDARSFRTKLDLVRQLGLRGYSVWVLGPEDPKTWDAVPARVAGR